MAHQAKLNSKAELIVFSSAKSNLKPISRRQRIVSDETVLIGWYIEKPLSILNLEKPPFAHRPTPSTTKLPGALSSRSDEEIKTGFPAMAIHRDRMLHSRTTVEFMIRSPLAYDFALLLFRPPFSLGSRW